MRIWKQRKEQVPALLFIVSMNPPGYPSAWLRPRRVRFGFARQDHCSSTTSCGLNSRIRRAPGTADWQLRTPWGSKREGIPIDNNCCLMDGNTCTSVRARLSFLLAIAALMVE